MSVRPPSRTLHLLLCCAAALALASAFQDPGAGARPAVGRYTFDGWRGPALGVEYCAPAAAGPDSPVLIVVPGARRNAGDYRDQWQHLAEANRFFVLAIEGSLEAFPDEYAYNAGGAVDAEGALQPVETRLFAALEPLFDDFRARFGSHRERYSLYGHSAGGGFVHRFLLFRPDARVERAVAANPAFCTMPEAGPRYPFGLGGAGLPEGALARWLAAELVILLGDRDLGPRSYPLSSGPEARLQGPDVYTRGRAFHDAGLRAARQEQVELGWELEVVRGVGHSNTHMASHAVPHLFEL